ncbi:SH3 domain-containing protein [Sedimenticola hydrogenitrophicus]|uniref:SH3 domain-containing protein n=1 Tax=Sedimenticola hydrogenitrophicus TaxID=2967975 RepID=UPI0023AEC251|nr:SH3 domain-containing protein [Sedimenticola hydrogenitrophicus]
MNRKLRYAVPIVAVLAVGCNSTTGSLSKENMGSTLGAVGGALIGAKVAGGNNRWLGAAIGGALGFYAGKVIGRNLDERDRQALAAQTIEVLDQPTASVSTWQSDRSGAAAEIKTGEISYKSETREVKRLATVEAVPNIRLESREYQTTSALRVRSGPGTRYQTITTLQPGDRVDSAGRTENGWLMLAKKGVTVGYVHGDYVTPYNPIEQAKAEGIDLDSVELESLPRQEAFAGIDLDSMETTTSTVTAQLGCRDVQISVTTDQGTENETAQACQKPDGVWELG